MDEIEVTLKILNLKCTSCAVNIDFELEELEGVSNVTTSYHKSVSVVKFDPEKTTINQIQKVIENLGYSIDNSITNID